MNNIFIYSLVLMLLGICLGCSDELDISPISSVSVDSFFKTEADVELAVIGAYDELQNIGQYGLNFMMLMEIRADDAFVESPTNANGEYGEIDFFSLTPGNTRINASWNSCYRGIQRCNTVLNRIDGVEMKANLKSVRIGEVKFIRALTYFNIVRLWGDVPKVTTETSDPFDSFDQGRTPKAEVYQQIINDLSEAIDVLPSNNDVGRASKGAAQTLIGKVYLTLGNWSNAVSILEKVTGYTFQAKFE